MVYRNNFLSATRPIYKFSKFAGIHLFKIEKNNKILASIKYDIIDKILLIFLLLINIYLFQKLIRSITDENILHLFVIDRGIRIGLSVTLLNNIHALLWNFMNSNRNLKIFQKLIQFDDEVCFPYIYNM